MTARRDDNLEIPEIIREPGKDEYIKQRFLGKGGFAKCYEYMNTRSKEVFAGKIVSKRLLTKPHQKDKMVQEIEIHRNLKTHPHIVGFHTHFEDDNNVFVLLELCRRRSLMEMHKRRKSLTEPETRYFMRQLVQGCLYLHQNNIIHRDLKLGNLFLNDEMEVKIGDFGLATRVTCEGERKKTLCGTPNYIAPEVLNKKGHSFEVDVWSIGCIMYTLLIGKPPFETNSLRDTYNRIKRNEYVIPANRVSPEAQRLIRKLLQPDPQDRPTMQQVLADEYFACGYCPSRLPTSCLTTAPRFDRESIPSNFRRPLLERNDEAVLTAEDAIKKDDKKIMGGPGRYALRKVEEGGELQEHDGDFFLSDLLNQLNKGMAAKPADRDIIKQEEAEDPTLVPMLWISKWVDYSDKYGLGYQLCDDSVGVLFNDTTRLIQASSGDNLQYIDRDGRELLYTLCSYPEELNKKVTLLKYFNNYMKEHLLKAGGDVARPGDDMARLPYLKTWFRTRSAIVLHLSNGTLQINFFTDHTKIIICPIMGAVTYIDESKLFKTFRMSLFEVFGCTKDIFIRLKYARNMVERLLSAKSSSKKTTQ